MRDPGALISTEELAAALGQPELRVYDCTTYFEPPAPESPNPYVSVSGRHRFEEAHIPGADYLDLQGEFSDPDTRLHFMMAAPDRLAEAFGRHGLGAGSRVVLYSVGTMMWATRFWWMLRALGFDGAAVLDGGFEKWRAEGRPTETGLARGNPPARFTPSPRPGFFVDKNAVKEAIGQTSTVIVSGSNLRWLRSSDIGPSGGHALRTVGMELAQGLEPGRYGQPVLIPGSVKVPAASLVDPSQKTFGVLADAQAKFAAQGVTKDRRVICYCTSGGATTIDLFQLYQLGYDNLTLYDGSMDEWAHDPALPIEID